MKERDTDREEIRRRKVSTMRLISTSEVTTILYLEAQQEVFYFMAHTHTHRTLNAPFILIEFTNSVWSSLSCNTEYTNNNNGMKHFFYPHHFMPKPKCLSIRRTKLLYETNGGFNAHQNK